MAYEADISRANPACFLFLVDQSGSMEAPIGGSEELKMDVAANVLNRTLDEISQRCSSGDDIRNYFHIGILGYTTDPSNYPKITSVLPGTTTESPFLQIGEVVDVAEVVEKTVKVSDGAGGLVEIDQVFPMWIEPSAEYGTPMCATLQRATYALNQWIAQNPDSYPPIVIHITDGMSTDGNPEPYGREVMNLSTNDGNVLVFNLHLSESPARPVQFPSLEEGLPGQFAELLFRMSSVLPQSFRDLAGTMAGISVAENARGFVYNARIEELVHFLDIGTRGTTELH